MNGTDSQSLLALADPVAREAGAYLRERFERLDELRIETKSTPTDLVSEADVATERLIRERLAAARPGDAVLGEEGGDAAGTTGVRWVVDPLDGTVNYLFGIPQWCVSIAVEDDEGTLAGVVFDAMRDELWAATRDGAATLNGTTLRGSDRAELSTAMVATGFGYDAGVREAQARVLARLLPRVRDVRRLGSAALDLAWTAAGRYDVYYERGLNHWDIAAGELVCRRAGLVALQYDAVPPAGAGIVVGPPELAEALLPLVV